MICETPMPSCTINVAGEDYADFIQRHNLQSPEQLNESLGSSCVQYINQEYMTVYAPLAPLLPLTIQRYTYSAIPKLYTLLDTTSIDAAGISPVFSQPVINSRGEGVLVGVIDTGIDYQNPIFQNADNTTRILGIWDQGIQSGGFSIPGAQMDYPFLYGSYYTEEMINEALSSADPLSIVPSTDDNGHGTFMTAIAAGSATPSQDFIGSAPASSIAVVKLKPAKQYLRDFYLINESSVAFQENDIMTGVIFLVLLAYRYKIPLVIYLGLGTNQGSHDGASPLGRTLQSLGNFQGIATVCAAGNEVGLRHHFAGSLQADQEYQDVEIRVAPGENGFTLELWSMSPELYTVGFVSPTGEVIQQIPNILGNETVITFPLETTVITVNYRYSPAEILGQLIFMRFQAPTPGIWHIRVYNSLYINGIYHIWLPIEGFIQPDTVFLEPDPYTTIVDPGNAVLPITVSTYNHMDNSLYIHSSRGYTRTLQLKPDLAAPGVDVYGPGLSLPSFSADPNNSAALSYPMVRKTGSSVAAAHVAGAVADLFSWGITQQNDLSMNIRNIKSYLIQGAKRNPAYTYPNREWGYGTLDLYQTFLMLR